MGVFLTDTLKQSTFISGGFLVDHPLYYRLELHFFEAKMTQFEFVNPPNEMPTFVAIIDFFNGKLTVPAAEKCQKMTRIRKAINSGTTPMMCQLLWQLLTFFWLEINSSCSRKVSKDGTHSKSHQFLNPPNEVPTFVAILDFFLAEN